NAEIMKEFSSRSEAISYARQFTNSYVENIENRTWIWSQFPQYIVHTEQGTLPRMYYTLEGAIQAASAIPRSAISSTENVGWMWNNYPTYQVYQGDQTFAHWGFNDLKSAANEARKWKNSHIIDMTTRAWIWENITQEQQEQLRQGEQIFMVQAETDHESGY